MTLNDYLLVARGGRLLGRVGFFAPYFSADQLAGLRRLARRERLTPAETVRLMNAAAAFWVVAALASVVVVIGSFLVMASVTDHNHIPWGWYVPIAAGCGAFTWSAVLLAYAMVRARNMYDAVIAQRAGRLGNRVLAGMAVPRARDFWIATGLGLAVLVLLLAVLPQQ